MSDYTTLSLGRICPVPKGTYVSDQQYEYLDIVTYTGESYICRNREGAPADSIDNAVYWQKIAERGESALALHFADMQDYYKADRTRPLNSHLVKQLIDTLNNTITELGIAINNINDTINTGTVNDAQTIAGKNPESFMCANSCSWTCMTTCKGGCGNTCKGGCINACSGTCAGGCSTTCTGGCGNTCSGTCSRACQNDCSSPCRGSCYGSCSSRD